MGGCYLNNENKTVHMKNELFTLDSEWLPLDLLGSPYGDYYPESVCTVPLNATHVLFTGGYDRATNTYLTDTWILDLVDLAWTPSAPMPTGRTIHGCAMVGSHKAAVVGGSDGQEAVARIHMFHPETVNWSISGSLPPEAELNYYYYPRVFGWKGELMLLESFSENIWLRGHGNWTLMDVRLGANFDGAYDTAILVPDKFAEEL